MTSDVSRPGFGSSSWRSSRFSRNHWSPSSLVQLAHDDRDKQPPPRVNRLVRRTERLRIFRNDRFDFLNGLACHRGVLRKAHGASVPAAARQGTNTIFADRLSEAGAPGRSRTCDPRFRKPVLYPAELRARGRQILLFRPARSSGSDRRSYIRRGTDRWTKRRASQAPLT